MELFRLFGTIAINNSAANSAIDETTGNAQKSEGKISSAFKKVGAAVAAGFGTAAVANFGKSVVTTTASFEDGMLKVQSLSGATQEQYKQLSDAALNYGSTTAWTAKDVADAMGYMALAGFDTNEILDSTSGMLSLASASGEDLASVTDILTDSMTAFGDGADQANRYADVLATTQAKSNTTVGLLGEAFKYVAPLAGSYGYKLEDVSTALGMMANAGVKGSMAGTALSSVITRLGTNTDGCRDVIEKMGVSFYNSDGTARNLSDVMIDLCDNTKNLTVEQKSNLAKVVAGQEAQKGLLAILNQGSGAYENLQKKVENCDGAAADMAANMESGVGGAMRSMSSAVEGFKISLGEQLEKPVGDTIRNVAAWLTGTATPAVVDFVQKASAAFSELKDNAQPSVDKLKKALDGLSQAFQPISDAVQPLIDKFNQYVSSGNAASDASKVVNTAIDLLASGVDIAADAIGGLVDFVGNIVQGFKDMKQWCEDNSTAVDLLAVAVGTITALIIAANASQISFNVTMGVANGLLTAASVAEGIASAATTVWTAVCTTATAATTALGAAFTFLTSPIGLIIVAIGAVVAIGVVLYKNWDKIKEKASALGKAISEKWNSIRSKTSETWNKVKDTMTNAINSAKDQVSQKLETLKAKVKENGGGIKGLTKTYMDSVRDNYSKTYDAINKLTGGKLDTMVQKVKTGFKNAVKAIADKVADARANAAKFTAGILETISKLPGKVINVGINLVKGLWNGISNMQSWVISKIQGFGDSILTGLKNFFGIHSPSRVMRDQIGKNLALGVAEGITKNKKYAKASAAELGKAVVEAAEKKLDKYKTYHNMTLKQEVAFWDAIRKQCKKGTDARLDADKKYLEAKKSLNSQLAQAQKDYAKKEKEINADLKKDIKSLNDEYKKSVEDRQKTLLSSFSLFESYKVGDVVSGSDLIAGLESQVNALEEWERQIAALKTKLGDTDLFKAIQEMGVDSLQQVKALNNMSNDQLQYYEKLYAERQKSAKSEAATELESLRQSTDAKIDKLTQSAQTKIEKAQATYEKTCKKLGVTVADTMEKIPKDTKKSMKSFGSAVKKTMENSLNTVKSGVSKLRKAMDFEWKLPKIKIPKFKITGSFDLDKKSVPKVSVEWFKKAMNSPVIMNEPTAFGMTADGKILAGGEAGSEVVSGTDTLMNMISEAVAARNARMEELLGRMVELLTEYMPQMAGQKVVLDTGALVGQMAAPMDKALGKRYVKSGRRV